MNERDGLIRAVIEGANGRLFLGDQSGFRIESFERTNPFTIGRIELWRRTLRRRARELKRRGVAYVVAVVPDAHFLYRDDVPPPIALAPVSAGDRFFEHMAELRDITFVDPRRALAEARGLLEVYRKTDSHWTSYGAYVGYRALLRELARLIPVSAIAAREVPFTYRATFGDLGVSVIPERRENAPHSALSRDGYEVVAEHVGFRRVTSHETFAATVPAGRVLFDRDSNFNLMFDYVARSVRHMSCYGTTSSFYIDEVDRFAPEVVVSEIGERRLFLYESDHLRDGFADVFRADFSSPLGRIAQRALLALRGNQNAQARLVASELECERDLLPEHDYTIAQIVHADGDTTRARDRIDQALSAHPDRPSYLSMKASILLSAGDLRGARSFAERALDRAPFNGYHHEIYATVMLNSGEAPAARRHLEETLREIDDDRVLFYLHSLACEETGDRIGAVESIVQALAIDPFDPTFKERAVRLLGA